MFAQVRGRLGPGQRARALNDDRVTGNDDRTLAIALRRSPGHSLLSQWTTTQRGKRTHCVSPALDSTVVRRSAIRGSTWLPGGTQAATK
jgi:hypothetical protein